MYLFIDFQVDLLKVETKSEIDAKDRQIKVLQQTLRGMQEQLMASKKQQTHDDKKIKDLEHKLNANTKKITVEDNEVITLDKDDDVTEEPRPVKPIATVSGCVQVTQNDAKLIGM